MKNFILCFLGIFIVEQNLLATDKNFEMGVGAGIYWALAPYGMDANVQFRHPLLNHVKLEHFLNYSSTGEDDLTPYHSRSMRYTFILPVNLFELSSSTYHIRPGFGWQKEIFDYEESYTRTEIEEMKKGNDQLESIKTSYSYNATTFGAYLAFTIRYKLQEYGLEFTPIGIYFPLKTLKENVKFKKGNQLKTKPNDLSLDVLNLTLYF